MPVCDLIAEYNFMTDFNGINRRFPEPFYPSGVYDGEKPQYNNGPESIEYPNLTLPVKLYDLHGNEIKEGYYSVRLSFDNKYLNLYQINELKARVKVLKLSKSADIEENQKKEAELKQNLETAKIKKKLKKQRKAEEELQAFKETAAAGNYAELEDTGKGWYILKYSFNGIKASGIVQK